MFLVMNAKAKGDGLVWYSESTKIVCDLFVCPLANSQFTFERGMLHLKILQFLNKLTLL